MTLSKHDYRAVFISDTHLGFERARVDALAHFLASHHSEYLYLVGDIVDVWRMRRKAYWPSAHAAIIEGLLDIASNGTSVHYIVGNHDEMLRDWLGYGFSLGRIQLSNEADFYGKDGNRYLVVHGDIFDGMMDSPRGRRLMFLGARIYDVILSLDHHASRALAAVKGPRVNVAGFAKRQTEVLLRTMPRFEALLSRYARANHYDGVICGHIHTPDIRNIGDTRYMNCGDWLEHSTALVERHDGSWELLDWQARR